MDEGKRQKRPRRSFTDEFKAGPVRLVLDEDKTIPQVARDLDLTEPALRTWVERARADRSRNFGDTIRNSACQHCRFVRTQAVAQRPVRRVVGWHG
jgi:transposase